MAYITYSDQLRDPRWQKRRLEVLSSDNFTCQFCGSTTNTLNVHHFSYEKGDMAWDAPLSSLVTICEDCHKITHSINKLTETEKDLISLIQTCVQTNCGKNEYYNSISQQAIKIILEKLNNG